MVMVFPHTAIVDNAILIGFYMDGSVALTLVQGLLRVLTETI